MIKKYPNTRYSAKAEENLGIAYQIKIKDYELSEKHLLQAIKSKFKFIKISSLMHLGILNYFQRKDAKKLKKAYDIFSKLIYEFPYSNFSKTAKEMLLLKDFKAFQLTQQRIKHRFFTSGLK